MRIGLDISISAFNAAGSARHAMWLLRALQAQAPAHGAEVVPLRLPQAMTAVASGVRRKALVLFWEFVYAPRLMGLMARASRCNLVHAAGLMPLPRLRVPTVATIHDLLPVLYPSYFTRIMGLRMRRWLKLMLQADYIIASSHHTARDLDRFAGKHGETRVVYPGCFFADEDGGCACSSAGAAHILAVGTLEPRKNLLTVLRSYRALLDTGPAPPLRLVGPQGWMNADLAAEIEQLELADRVITTGFVSDVELARLYCDAALLVYPSLYEGFGFPPLEAMHYGCPVVASNVSSLPEVVGDAGVLVEPTSVQQLASTMRLLLDQPSLAAELRARGYAQAQRFSWERCANETFAIYQDVLQRHGQHS